MDPSRRIAASATALVTATTRSGGEYEHPKGYDPAGPHADRRTRALEIPGLGLQQDRHATGAALIVGIKVSCDDGLSSPVQVTNATTASKDGTGRGTDSITTPAHTPKRMKKSGINKIRASPIPGQGEALQVDNEPDETRNLLGGKCLLNSKRPASSRDQPRRKYPWGSVGGWNIPRDKPLDTQPLPSKQPVLLTDRNGLVQQSRI